MALGDLSSGPGSLEYDIGTSESYNRVVNVRDNIYAVAYQGPGTSGFLKTFTVDANGNISGVTDTLNFEGGQCISPSLCLVTTGMLAVSYTDQNSKGSIRTFSVDATGHISDTPIDFLRYTEAYGGESSLVNCGFNDIFAVAYRGASNDGYLTTFSIDSAGEISDTVIQTYEFDTGHGEWHSLIKVAGNIFVDFYSGPGYVGTVKSFRINNDGSIDTPYEASKEVDTDCKWEKQVLLIGTDILAFFYSTSAKVLKIKTLSIDSYGVFGATFKGPYTFPDTEAWQPSACHVALTCYAVAYRDDQDDGWVKTILIQDNGDIAVGIAGSLEFDDDYGINCCIAKTSGDYLLIVYTGTDTDGWAKTVAVITAAAEPPHHELLMGIGP